MVECPGGWRSGEIRRVKGQRVPACDPFRRPRYGPMRCRDQSARHARGCSASARSSVKRRQPAHAACASSSRSNGSRVGGNGATLASAWRGVMSISPNPIVRQTPGSSDSGTPTPSLPSLSLMAISHNDAERTIRSWSFSTTCFRILAGRIRSRSARSRHGQRRSLSAIALEPTGKRATNRRALRHAPLRRRRTRAPRACASSLREGPTTGTPPSRTRIQHSWQVRPQPIRPARPPAR